MQEWAINYVRQWRSLQNLESLSAQEEYLAAEKLLQSKGFIVPKGLEIGGDRYYFKDGEYKAVEKMKLVESVEINPTPWNPQDNREFWCEKLGFFVRLTGDLDINNFYRVTRLGDGSFRPYQVRGHELVLKENAPTTAPSTDLLKVNSASWAEIKNHICDKFIQSYPWRKQADKSPSQVREDMMILAKSKNKGLAKIIEEERMGSNGAYEGMENFCLRMTALHDQFPWADFAQTLDFIP